MMVKFTNVFKNNQCTVPENTTLQDSTNSMRNLHQILLQEDGIEAWHLFRLWEKLQLGLLSIKTIEYLP